MAKFHVTEDGPKPCTASQRACKYGPADDHYQDREAAQKAFENKQEAVPTSLARTLPRFAVPVKVTPFAGGRYFGCHINKTRVTSHLVAMQEELGVAKMSVYEGNKVKRDRGYIYHMTVVSPPEMKDLRGRKYTDFPENPTVTFEGLGRVNEGENEAYYIVCSSPELDKWREDNGLPKKDFHITLGFSRKDVHTMGKGEDTIFKR